MKAIWGIAAGTLLAAAQSSVFAAAESARELAPGTEIQLEIGAGTTQTFDVNLPEDRAADLYMTQRIGFVDIAVSQASEPGANLRTESGIEGSIDVPLLASTARSWRVVITPRAGKGAGSVTLRLSALRRESAIDMSKRDGFEHYVEAEDLRHKNYRETVAVARPPSVDARTQAAYAAAEAQYAAADDGCGLLRVRIGVARMQVTLGNYAAARTAATAALDARCPEDLAERAQSLKTIGMAAAYQGEFSASADAAEQALALYRRTGDLRYQGIVLGNLSSVYMQLGATDRALAAADGALQAAEATADGQGIVFSRKSIADIHLERGELASALQDYRHTLDNLAVTPYPMIEAETWNQLGIVYHRMADYPDSLEAYAKALSVWKQMGSRGGVADTLIDEAQTLLEHGDVQSAVHQLHASLAIARRDGLKSTEVRALRGLGDAGVASKDLGTARRYFNQSLVLAKTTGEIPATSYALRGIGAVDFLEGHTAAAQRNDEAALKLAWNSGDRDAQAATLAQLARVLMGHDLIGARRRIDQALSIIETQRGLIDDPSLRTSYFASMREYSAIQIDILMQIDARFPHGRYALQALVAAERARARSLQDMFVEKSIDLAPGLPTELKTALRGAEERVRIAALSLDREHVTTEERRQSLIKVFDAASRELDTVRGQVRSANPRYADLIQPVNLDVEHVQQALLDDDVAVVEYWLSSPASYAWVLTRNTFRAVRLPSRAVIEGLNADLVTLLHDHSPRASLDQGFEGLFAAEVQQTAATKRAGARLGAAVMPPALLHGLPRKVAVVADGALQGTPFGILPLPDEGRSLAMEYDLSYLPSITTIEWLRRERSPALREPSIAIFAAPILEPPGGAVPQSDGMASLPYSRQEAETIAALLPKDRVWLALGHAASRAKLLNADWRGFTMVHFATHAIVDLSRPEMSGIVLTRYDAAGHGEDGVLRMNDIYNLKMPVDLVVLSGCATATGRDFDAEGVFSLSRAFLYAGTPRVLASLWPVEDRATAAFMEQFYRALLVEHMSAAGALRFAQQRLARDKRWASPYYWAAFVLQGDWE